MEDTRYEQCKYDEYAQEAWEDDMAQEAPF